MAKVFEMLLNHMTDHGNRHGGSKAQISIEKVFRDLMEECRNAAPAARLSSVLRNKLETNFSREDRKAVVSKKVDGCAPLFVVCKKGNVEIVEYLITVCGADVEQRGRYEVPDDHSVHNVTPLWCASVAGQMMVVQCLVEHGADVNSVSDTGSTPVRSACFMTHLPIVQFLVQHGADILKPNYNGGTCLINSVQSRQLCEFLIKHGAIINAQDIQKKTALHYAIHENRMETVKLLLEHGADPFIKSRYGDDALQVACLTCSHSIVEYLVKHIPYSPTRTADSYELLGAMCLDDLHDMNMTLFYWRHALAIRSNMKNPAAKSVLPPRNFYRNIVEFRTAEELLAIEHNVEVMRINALLICERVLGELHKDNIFRLMFRGAACADMQQVQFCIDLWQHALRLRIKKDSILHSDTSFTAQALTRLYEDFYEKQSEFADTLKYEDCYKTLELLFTHLPESYRLLNILPVYQTQVQSYDHIVQVISHLLHLLCILDKTKEQSISLIEITKKIVLFNPKTSSGNTLLHLAVMKSNSLRKKNLPEENPILFPSILLTNLLLDCDFNSNLLNLKGSTALMLAADKDNYNPVIVNYLLEQGSHIDQKNNRGDTALSKLMSNPDARFNPWPYITLRCLAAMSIKKYRLQYRGEVPSVLEPFVEMH